MYKKALWLGGLFLTIAGGCKGQATLNKPIFDVASAPWEMTYGNHRAVLTVKKPGQAVRLSLLWRRHDPNPAKKRFVIVNAATQDTVQNIYRVKVNEYRCTLIFGPIQQSGTYYFYYLPFRSDHQAGSYRYGYYSPEKPPSKTWVANNKLKSPLKRQKLPKAKVKEIQARTEFSSFYPMQVVPTPQEKQRFFSKYHKNYLVFPETRTHPIQMRDEIPLRWIKKGPKRYFNGIALRNEYYVFQLGVYAHKMGLNNVKINFQILQALKTRYLLLL